MAVQQEIKSQLAKLLATEDIVVEHKHCETAQFNVDSRILILPLWEKASHNVYDMLVGHEVGHALFTPDVDWSLDLKVPQQFVNVVEDARIEKLMKRKYLGIAKSFYRGYNELHEQDFFELDGQDISNFNLADRANLHFKIGSFLPISFSDPEKEIITLIQMPRPLLTPSQQQKRYIISVNRSRKRKSLSPKRIKLNRMLNWILKGVGIATLIALAIIILPFLTLIAMLLWKVGSVILIVILGWMILILL